MSFISGIDTDEKYYENNKVNLVPMKAMEIGETCYISDVIPEAKNNEWTSFDPGYLKINSDGLIEVLRTYDFENISSKIVRLVNSHNESVYIWIYDSKKLDMDTLQFELEKGTSLDLIEERLTKGSKAEKTYKKVEEISKKIIKPGMSDYEKVKAVSDYICGTIKYDYEWLEESYGAVSTAYEALTQKRAVCSGFAQATSMLLNYNGVKAIDVIGNGFIDDPSVSHEWNLVCIDGNWFHVDNTWDSELDDSEYNYFLISDKTITLDHPVWSHSLSGKIPYPAAPNDYFVNKSKSYMSNPDKMKLKGVLLVSVVLNVILLCLLIRLSSKKGKMNRLDETMEQGSDEDIKQVM